MVGLTRLSLANRAVVVLVCLVIVGVGLYATGSLKQELYPSLKIPGATVVSVYAGAPPETVERDVSKPVEDAVKGVSGVTKVSSTSSASSSQVKVEWDYSADSADLEGKVRSAVEGIKSKLPEDVDPKVTVGSLDDLPVLMLAASSSSDAVAMADRLENIAAPKLRSLPGVRDVQVTGQQTRNVVITTRQGDLDRLKVEASQLTQLMQAYKAAVPGGEVVQSGRNVSVQVGKRLDSVEEIKRLQLQGTDGPVALQDVADVSEGPADATSFSRVNGRPALSLSVTKTPEANTVAVSHEVTQALPALGNELGGDTTFTTVFDQAPFVEQSIHNLAVEGGLGLVMAILVILVFLLSVRSTIITAISIPMSLLIATISLYAGGFTLNLLTLSGLTVAVGRVVDDSIVVIENIKRHQGLGEQWGPGLIVGAVREVAGAVTSSTITTVAVFLPIALVSGQVGELFRPFAVTVTVALLASLVVSLSIVPVLSFWFMRPSRRPSRFARRRRADAEEASAGAGERVKRSHESEETRLQKAYLPVLGWSLRRPVLTLVIAVVLFAGTMLGATQLKTDFLGASEQTTLSVSQKLPPATALAETDKAARQVEQVLGADPDVQSFQTTVGGGGLAASLFGGVSQSNQASFSVTLRTDAHGDAVSNRLRDAFAGRPELGEMSVSAGEGAAGSNDLEVQISGGDAKALQQASEQVRAMMSRQPGVGEVRTDLAEQRSVLQVNVREPDAARQGLNQGTIGQAVMQAMRGQTLGEVTIDGRREDMVLRSRPPLQNRQELEELQLPVTQRQTADVQKKLSDELTAKQDEQSDKQQRKADEQLDEQADQLGKQREELNKNLNTLTDQLNQLESMPASAMAQGGMSGMGQGGMSQGGMSQGGGLGQPGAGPNGGAVPGGTPQQQGAAAQAQAAGQAQAQQLAAAQAQKQAQAKQLREQVDKLREQLDKLDEQESKLAESRREATEQRQLAEEMKQLSEDAKNAKGSSSRLKQVADVVEVPTTATIQRAEGQRTVTVTAKMTGGDLSSTTSGIQQGLTQLQLPAGTTASIGGVSTEQQEAFAQLGLAMLIAIAIVYMVMVATFKSLLQPLILLVSVPFAATGAVGLLLLTGTALGIPSMIGLLMLIGIVVTNAIVLIDLVNHYRAEGAEIDDAVIHGARLRLRPIIMTALATIMALVPMALGVTGGGVFISTSLAVVVIGGLVSSTLLTLILVPVLYHLVEKLRERIGTRREPVTPEGQHVALDEMLDD